MKRLVLIATASIVFLSLVAGVIALSPRKSRGIERDKQESEASEADMNTQDAGTVDRRLIGSTTRFGFKLFGELSRTDGGRNLFISPVSIAMALAMTYNGAGGETKNEMAHALEIGSISVDDLNRAYSAMRLALASPDPKVRLDIANSLWARQGVSFKPDFIQRTKQFYGAQVTLLDFADPASPMKMNSWVKEKTNGKIDRIIDQIDPMAVLYLMNAIYFKGAWTREFKKPDTKEEPFNAADQQLRVQMMHQSGDYGYFETPAFQAVRLPYGGGRVSAYVFLPAANSNLASFQKSLTADTWESWMSNFANTPGDIGLPRFKIEYETTLNDALQALGMPSAFDPQRANFKGMADSADNISINRVRHKTFCEVNEEGTEAAAVTSVEMVATSVAVPRRHFKMLVDRPFFFAIRDNQTGTVLFLGSISNPQ